MPSNLRALPAAFLQARPKNRLLGIFTTPLLLEMTA
jgi:hypothetical protein